MEVNSKQFPEDPIELVLLNDEDPDDLHIFKTYYRPLFNSTLKKEKVGALQQPEEILEHIEDGILIYDVLNDGEDFIFKYINPRMEKVLKKGKKEVGGVKLTDVFPESEKFGLLKILREVYHTGTPKTCEIMANISDEIIHWSQNRLFKLNSGDILVLHYDKTELKRSEKRYDDLFNRSIQGLAILPDNNHIIGNKALSQITGYRLDEIYGVNCKDLSKFLVEPVDCDDFETLLNNLISSKTGTEERELPFIHKNGTVHWIRTFSVPINYQGKPAIQVSCVDITRRKKAEEKTKKQAEELFKIKELAKVATFSCDLVNRNIEGDYDIFSEIFECDLNSVEDTLKSFFDRTLFINLKKLETQKSFKIEHSFFLDKEKDVITRAEVEYSEDGEPVKLIGYTQDITETKNYQKKLKKTLDEKEVLIREVYHRVRNNMQVTLSLLNLQARYDPNKNLVNAQNRIRAIALAHEKACQSSDLTEVNIKDYIKTIIQKLKKHVQNKKINVNINVPSDLKLGIDTAIPLGLMLNELLTNIIKHAFPHTNNGNVDLSLKPEGNNLILKIEDNGIGLPETININNPKTLGLNLINGLVSQLDGTLKLIKTHGTAYEIEFKELNYQNRI